MNELLGGNKLRNKQGNLGIQIILLLGVLLFCINSMFWPADPAWLQVQHPASLLNKVNLAHSFTQLGLPIFLLSSGYLASRQLNVLAKAFKIWLFTIFVGLVAVFLLAWLGRSFYIGYVYDKLFLLTRNSSPIISGIILGCVLLAYLQKNVKPSHVKIYFVLSLLLLALPSIFNKSILGLSDPNTIQYSLLVFLAGALLNLQNYNIKHFLGKFALFTSFIFALQILLVLFAPSISMAVHVNLTSTTGRVISSTSFIQILAALCIVGWFSILPSPFKLNNSTIVLGSIAVVACATNWPLIQTIINTNRSTVNNSSMLLLKRNVTEIIPAMIAIFLLTVLLSRLPAIRGLNRGIEKYWGNEAFLSLETAKDQLLSSIKSWWHRHQRSLLTILCAYLLSLMTFMTTINNWQVSPNVTLNYNSLAYVWGARQSLVLLNTLFIWLLFKFIWALTGHYWLSSLTTLAFVILFSLGNYLKIKARNEPVLPTDIAELKAWRSLLGMVDLTTVLTTVIGLLLLFVLIFFLERRFHVRHEKLLVRFTWLILPVLFFSCSFRLNHQRSLIHTLSTGTGNDPTFYNQLAGAQKNGPLLQFMNNLDVTVMAKPEGYSGQTMTRINKKYRKKAAEINKTRPNSLSKQTVIFNLSESFADPTHVPGVTLKEDPMPFIRQLKQKTTSGYMISSGYGGGTANMEYMALSGFPLSSFSATLPTPFTQLVPKLSWNPTLVTQFSKSIAIHPYLGNFYDRPAVYQKFGFDEFMYLGSRHKIRHQRKIERNPYLSDETAYENTLDQIKQNKKSLFINLVTMQNHFPYDENFYNDTAKFGASGTSVKNPSQQATIDDFSMGIHYTDEAVKKFIKEIDQINKPITFVFYGDHLPGIYSGVDMSLEGLKLHQPDYFIYSNKYALNHGAKNKLSGSNQVATNDFTALSLEQSNSKVTAYQALLTQVQKQLPTLSLNTKENLTNNYNSQVQFTNKKGQIIDKNDLTAKQKALYHQFKLVQYDVTAGKHYLKNQHFNK